MRKPFPCGRCGVTVLVSTTRTQYTPFCPPCREARKAERQKTVTTTCATCGAMLTLTGRAGLERARQQRTYCSTACRATAMSASSRRTAVRDAARSAARMRERNPTAMPGVVEKIKTSRGGTWRPPHRGAASRAPTPTQLATQAALGSEWVLEHHVKLGPGRDGCRLDVAHPQKKIAVELDGPSHYGARRKRDELRDARLRGLGWIVLRFSNQAATERLAECVQTVTSTTSR